MVLLTLLFLQTMLDIILVSLLGPVCVIHWKRGLFKHKLSGEERKYFVALEHFGLIIVQLSLISITLPCMLMNFTPTKQHLKKLIQNPPS